MLQEAKEKETEIDNDDADVNSKGKKINEDNNDIIISM